MSSDLNQAYVITGCFIFKNSKWALFLLSWSGFRGGKKKEKGPDFILKLEVVAGFYFQIFSSWPVLYSLVENCGILCSDPVENSC